ncbi:MAG: glycosyltransferase family 4 protein [Bacteriovoracales bacterium]|nr:glycosyltransferase family 4 protein [Bacteriovoracales bacterium]
MVKRKERIACILSLEGADWVSCKTIVPNLFKLYKKSFPEAEIKTFHYADSMEDYEYFLTISGLVDFLPDKIIICDHKPHPARLIRSLFKEFGEDRVPSVYCHLFGDFSLYAPHWWDLEFYLQRMNIHFIAASHRQVNFVKQFIEGGEEFVSYLPFPADDKKFCFSKDKRKSARNKFFPHGRNETRFLYSGRLSAQKNTISLIRSFKDFLTLSGSNASLHIVGFFDDLAYPFFGIHYPPELNRYEFLEELNSYDDSIKSRIEFVENLSSDQLIDYYQACDVLVSTGLHNDEDYGMSPAEAKCCGMSLILSNWGGYASFSLPDAFTSLVNVSLVDSFYQVDYKHFIKLLIKYDTTKKTDEDRKKLSSMAVKRFGIDGNIPHLLDIHSLKIKKFSSWNRKFQKFSGCFKNSSSNPFGLINSPKKNELGLKDLIEEGLQSKSIYRSCYNEYVDFA